MAQQKQLTPDAQKANDDLSFELRRVVNNAYSFVEGAKTVQSFSALTIEECLDQQIELIEGGETTLRPNQLHRVDKIEQDLLSAVKKIKDLPDYYFDPQKEKDNVNTDVTPVEET